ncbi:MAG: hypothetical protein J0H82_06170 [Alphaproteobacteria bacterium]|nr:hypothetical protein [Alphaproteobacteria bacterium]
MDEVLAAALADIADPVEAIIRDCPTALGHNVVNGSLGKPTKIVRLACSHFTITDRRATCPCRRCGAMIRAGYDYDAFRRLGALDEFDWPKDRLKNIHQPRRGDSRWTSQGRRDLEPEADAAGVMA